MADTTVNLPGQILESRYATQHVGGAFNAKNLSRPKTIEKAIEDARWTKNTGSMYLMGFDPTRYPYQSKPRTGKPEPVGSGLPGNYLPKPFIPTPPQPFGPLIRLPITIFWNTDPDTWDQPNSNIGQSFWDIYDIFPINDGFGKIPG